jgi:hypothetical protein
MVWATPKAGDQNAAMQVGILRTIDCDREQVLGFNGDRVEKGLRNNPVARKLGYGTQRRTRNGD